MLSRLALQANIRISGQTPMASSHTFFVTQLDAHAAFAAIEAQRSTEKREKV
jgi:hypothetical protein